MKKLTWALLSLMLFLGLGVAFGVEPPTISPNSGIVAAGTKVTFEYTEDEDAQQTYLVYSTVSAAAVTITGMDDLMEIVQSEDENADAKVYYEGETEIVINANQTVWACLVVMTVNPDAMSGGDESDGEDPGFGGPMDPSMFTVTSSEVVSAEYVVLVPPTFTPDGSEEVEAGAKVTMSHTNGDDISGYIVYSTVSADALKIESYADFMAIMQDENPNATTYYEGDEIEIDATKTIWACFAAMDMSGGNEQGEEGDLPSMNPDMPTGTIVSSEIVSATFTVKAEGALKRPTFTPAPGDGSVQAGTKVTISHDNGDPDKDDDGEDLFRRDILYTFGDKSLLENLTSITGVDETNIRYYEGPITLDETTTIHAMVVDYASTDFTQKSSIATATYTVEGEASVPKLTVTPAGPITVNGSATFSCALDPDAYTHESNSFGFVLFFKNGSEVENLEYQVVEGNAEPAADKWTAYRTQDLTQIKSGSKLGAIPRASDNNATYGRVIAIEAKTVYYRLTLPATATTEPELVFNVLELNNNLITWESKVLTEASVKFENAAPAITVAQPVITPDGSAGHATIKLNQKVTIECATTGASIYYTLDGTAPDNTKTLYEAPFLLPDNTPVGEEITIRAIAILNGVSSDARRVALMVEAAGEGPDDPTPPTPVTKPNAPKFEVNGTEVTAATLEVSATPAQVKWIGEANNNYTVIYTLDGSEDVFDVTSAADFDDDATNYWYFGDEAIDVKVPVTIKARVAATDNMGAITWSDMTTLALTLAEAPSTKPAAPTFAEPLEVKQGEVLKINLPEDLDLADYLDGAFILYVENDDKTELTYEGTWNELLAWAQGAPGGPDDEDPGYPGFPDDDFGVGFALTADEEPVAEPAYKVAYYDAEEEMWRPAAFLATVGDAVKVRARLAVGKDANGTLIYSDETNATYKVSANTLKTPTFFVNGEELKAATVKVTPGTQVSFESGYEDAEEAGDYEYVICYAFDATDEDFDNASAIALTMGESNIMMYYPDFTKIEVNKSGKLMARVAQMYSDGHIWWSASKEVTFEVDFVIEVSPLLGGDTFGKNVALGVSVNIGETNPIGMPMYADNKYPTAVYYTIDGTTEPSKAAYDAQADKVNGAIKKLENTLEDGFAVMDANGNNISLPLFDKDIHLKAKAYVTKGEETVETVLFDKALKVKAGANPGLNPVSGTVVKVGDTIVIKNPAPLSDGDDEYGGYGGDGDGDLSEAALGTLYFSFDGTLPTIANFGSQEYDEENEADPYHAWNVWQAAEGADVKIMIQEDAQGLYAYVPAIGESIWTPQKDTIRLEGGMLFVQAWCLTAIEAGRDPRTGMSKTFDCGSDFIKGAYTDGSVSLTFDPASGAEVDENTAVAITASQNVEIFYMMFESEEAAKAAAWDQEKALSYSSELKPVLSLEKTTIKAAYALAGADVVMNDFSYATYTVKELPAITLTFNPASGSEVEDNTKVTVTASREVEIFYNLYADKAAADADKETFMANAKEVAEDGMPVITKAAPYLLCAVTDRGEMKYFDATYTVKGVANEEEELAGVSVYPNPSNGMFNLELPVAATVEVFASNGVLVQRMKLGEGNATLNIERSGIYFLRITGEGRTAIKRVIVR